MSGLGAYKEAAVTTQNKGQLIVLLYEGTIKFLRRAIRNMEEKDYESKSENITRALDIITELNVVLDMEAGGEIAQNLRSLYNFMNKHICQASIRKDPQMLQEVITLLEELNQSWRVLST